MPKKKAVSKAKRQKEQAKMVERAMKQPGVATAMEVYSGASQYVPVPVAEPFDTGAYATGGNPR
jgi:hypothetical protein